MRTDLSTPEFQRFLKEIDDHFVYVVGDLLQWKVLERPQIKVGSGNVVLRFKTQEGLFIFRVPQHSQQQLRRVALAYQHFGPSGLMPEPIYRDGKCVLERYVEGLPLSDRATDAELVTLAQKLALVHAVPADRFGVLSHGSTGIHADADASYAPLKVESSDDSTLEDAALTPDESSAFDAMAHRAALVPVAVRRAPCFLGHGDLLRNNIVLGAQGVYFIDWDRIGSYPREHDFVFLTDADLSPRQQALVLAHYPQALDPVLLNWYALRRVVGGWGISRRAKLALAERHGLLP